MKKVKVIDVLEMISNGEIPEKVIADKNNN